MVEASKLVVVQNTIDIYGGSEDRSQRTLL
jgi:hypothetical protein